MGGPPAAVLPRGDGDAFESDGAFSTPVTLFPGTAPTTWEWHVVWNCGATLSFAGLQGTSSDVTFTVLPAAATPTGTYPALPATSGPAAKPAPCADLAAKARARCLALRRRNAAFRACAKLTRAGKRAACRRQAAAVFARRIRAIGR